MPASGVDEPLKVILLKLPTLESWLVLFSSEVTETDAPAVEAVEDPNLNIDAAGNEGAGVEVEIPPLEIVNKSLNSILVVCN